VDAAGFEPALPISGWIRLSPTVTGTRSIPHRALKKGEADSTGMAYDFSVYTVFLTSTPTTTHLWVRRLSLPTLNLTYQNFKEPSGTLSTVPTLLRPVLFSSPSFMY